MFHQPAAQRHPLAPTNTLRQHFHTWGIPRDVYLSPSVFHTHALYVTPSPADANFLSISCTPILPCPFLITETLNLSGSGCGSVGRAVASVTRGLWFESSHRHIYLPIANCIEKTKIKKKRPEMAHSIQKHSISFSFA